MDPDPFQQSFAGMLAARALISGTELGLFDALAAGPSTAAAVASARGLDPLGAEVLLDALRSLGYVEARSDGTYALTDVSRRLLISNSSESIATFVGAQNDDHWSVLDQLDEVITGRRAPSWHAREATDPMWERYIRGLYEASRGENEESVALVPVTEPRRMIDVAGGHGGFAMAMCRVHPRLDAAVLDLPASTAVGRRIVAECGMSDRVDFVDRDVLADPFPDSLDVVSAFNLIHHLSPEENEGWLRKAHRALVPGGFVVIGDNQRPEPDEPVHQLGALSALLFYAMSGSRTWTIHDVTGWLHNTGFVDTIVHRNPSSPWRVVFVARRA